MANLSQQKRQRMLEFLQKVRDKNKDDDEALIAINEIESEITEKKYGLVWERHSEDVEERMIDEVPIFIEEAPEKEIAVSNDNYNFLLEGDNLHSLHLLEKTHKEAVDLIYIDPPYNTGNKEFIYDDDRKGVGKEDAYRHSKWLSFMERRLSIAKRLLANDGLIFISIDDNEYAQLKLLCDSIFGSDNFLNMLIWNKNSTTVMLNREGFSTNTEYILVYKKNLAITLNNDPIKDRLAKSYNKDDGDGRGPYGTVHLYTHTNGNKERTLRMPDGTEFTAKWQVTQETFDQYVKDGLIVKTPSGWRKKIYLSNCKGSVPVTLLDSEVVGFTKNGTNELKDIFGVPPFPYPKPVSLIKYIISKIPKKNALVLDFFAGSGTTGQAVLELNRDDGGNRHFILCTNNENNICDEVTYPRLRTVITGIRQDGSKYSNGISSNLKYYHTAFTPKDSESLTEQLLEHVDEMIQLEYGVKIDKDRYVSVLTDADADELEQTWSNHRDIRCIYISRRVLLTASQRDLFNTKDVFVIPDYYFRNELKEAGEI